MLVLLDELPVEGGFRLVGRGRGLRGGDQVLLGDGRGGTAPAVVTSTGRGWVEFDVGPGEVAARGRSLVVVRGVESAGRDALDVTGLTMPGVGEIAPLAEGDVLRELERRRRARLRYWQAAAREAAERVGMVWVPRVSFVYGYVSLLRRFEWGASGFVVTDDAVVDVADVELPDSGDVVLVDGWGGDVGGLVAAGVVPVRGAGAAAVLANHLT